jgi:hypothetical protein
MQTKHWQNTPLTVHGKIAQSPGALCGEFLEQANLLVALASQVLQVVCCQSRAQYYRVQPIAPHNLQLIAVCDVTGELV